MRSKRLVAGALLVGAVAVGIGAPVAATDGGAERRKAELRMIEAARWGRLDDVKGALATGTNANAVDGEGVSAVRWAALEGYLEVVQALIGAGADVNLSSEGDVTPLMMAARWGHLEVVTALLAAGAEVDRLSTVGPGRTALMYAAISGHRTIVDELLAYKADPTPKDRHGRTAADLADRWGQHEIAALLRAAAAKGPAQK